MQVCVVNYITRTPTHSAELKAYWHLGHSANDQEVKKAAENVSCIITLISQKISLESYILYGNRIPKAVNPW